MATIRELVTELTLKVDKAALRVADAMMGKLDNSIQKVDKHSRSAEGGIGRMTEVMGGIGTAAIAGGVAIAGLGIALTGMMLKTAMAFENLETILVTTEGSEAAAKDAMDWVSGFAARTPFELQEVTEAFVKMRAYGLDPMNGSLSTLGDASAAMGKDVMQGVEMLADAVTGEFERMKELGIKGSKKGGMATFEYTDKKGLPRFKKVMSNDRKAIEKAILEIFSEKYDGAMVRLAGTMMGILSNIGDTWARFQMMVMDSGAFEAIKTDLLGILSTLNTMADDGKLTKYASTVGGVLLNAYKVLKVGVDGATAAGKFFVNNLDAMTATGKVLTAVLGGIAVAYAVLTLNVIANTVAWALNTIAIIANKVQLLLTPIGLITVLLISLGFWIADVVTHWDDFKKSAKDAFAGLPEGVQNAIKWMGSLGTKIAEVAGKWLGFKAARDKDAQYQAQLLESGIRPKAGGGGGSKSLTANNTANTTVNVNGGGMTPAAAKKLGSSFASGSLSGFRALEAFGI